VTLRGRTILVTRARERAEDLAGRLRALEARVLVAPVIRIEPVPVGGSLERAVRDAAGGEFEWVAFTSEAGVDAYWEATGTAGVSPPRARVAAVGEATAAALRRRGVTADLVPEAFTTEALGRAFPEGSGRVLLPRADIAPPDLQDLLAARGWTPVPVDAYRTAFEDALPAEAEAALKAGEVDAVTFTSASTVEGFVRLAGAPPGPAAVCIGPVTADAARRAGLEVAAVADPHTIDGLVAAVRAALSVG
jgi:uroporphyrinogen-III synthase